MAKQGPRKKLPKELAVINADNCTGCEACLEVCPVDCIVKIQQYDAMYNLQSWCQIDLERCVGCEVCVHIPRKKTDPYELTVCPWDAIEMVPDRTRGPDGCGDRRTAGVYRRKTGTGWSAPHNIWPS